jgi:branched-chain amino acid aminotransferase
MNIFFVVDNQIITPSLGSSILPGITRLSCIELLKSWGYTVSERKISIEELYKASQEGLFKEAFGTGTAAIISPIGELNWNNKIITLNQGQTGPVAQKLYNSLTDIQCGDEKDIFNWTEKVI